jgi:hypothetical protein
MDELQDGDEVTTLPCFHSFHSAEINKVRHDDGMQRAD